MRIKALFPTLLILGLFTCLPILLNAQFDDPDPDPPATSVPFDGGLSLLIAAGAGYAAKKAYDKRKKDSRI